MADNNPFRFSTKYTDSETGLVYYGYRFYSPSVGRWISRDPIGESGGANLYATVLNDTVNKIDPNGLTGKQCCQAADEAVEAAQDALTYAQKAYDADLVKVEMQEIKLKDATRDYHSFVRAVRADQDAIGRDYAALRSAENHRMQAAAAAALACVGSIFSGPPPIKAIAITGCAVALMAVANYTHDVNVYTENLEDDSKQAKKDSELLSLAIEKAHEAKSKLDEFKKQQQIDGDRLIAAREALNEAQDRAARCHGLQLQP